MKAALLVSLFFALTSAAAAPLVPAPGMPKTVVLKSKANDFDKWKKPLPCIAGSYSTTITLRNLTPGDPWESAAQIILHIPGVKGGAAVFSIMTKWQQTPLYARLDVTGKTRSEPRYSRYAPSPLQPGKPIDITFTWAVKAGVQVIINGKDTLDVRTPLTAEEFEVTASGATAKFDNNHLVCNLIA